MANEKKPVFSVGPFGVRIDAPKQTNFDKYYFEYEERKVYKKTGQVDENGDELGVEVTKYIEHKTDIAELINSQADQVGVDSYVKALMQQGVDISELNTGVGDDVQDFSQFPDTLADTLMAGDKAKEAFAKLDPALKGNHTTIDGFLNGLTQEMIDNYINGRLQALMPQVKKGETE